MNKRIKRLWIKALRSGKYEQGKRRLRRDGRFCCLGVLCDVHRKEVGGRWEKVGEGVPEYMGEILELPDEVVEWAGLGDSNPDLPIGEFPFDPSLAEQNDKGVSFPRIAELIEKYL